MTKLIVAMDGCKKHSHIRDLAYDLKDNAGIEWMKIGPLSFANYFLPFNRVSSERFKTFLDLKLADTAITTTEAVKRFADMGIASISTFTDEATEAAVKGAEGTPLKIWRVLCLNDNPKPATEPIATLGAHGMIMPGVSAIHVGKFYKDRGVDVITPGIRISPVSEGIPWITNPEHCNKLCITYAVVGKPIWGAENPVTTAKWFMEELNG